MATTDVVGGSYYNLISLHPLFKDKQFNDPARNLFRNNTLMMDAVVQPANDLMSHQGSYGIYAGRGAEAIKVGGYRTTSTVGWGTFKDDISIFSDASAIPKDVADLRGTQWMEEEEASKANYFMQACEAHLLYGTNGPTPDTYINDAGTSTTPTAAPEKYTGLAARYRTPDNADGGYDALNPDPATAAQQGVWSAGGTGTDTTSIWFVRWGRRACSLITPENDPQYGLKIEDLGVENQWYVDSTSHEPAGYRRCYVTEYEYKHGLSIYPGENQGHHVARLRNIENSTSADHTALPALIYQIIEEYFLRDTNGIFMYVPPRMMTIFDILYEAKTNIEFSKENPYALAPEQWGGRIFLRSCPAISKRETHVAAV
jgi:hypothetical protein